MTESGQNQRGGDEKDRAGKIAGDDELARLELWAADECGFAFEVSIVRAEFAQSDFGVVAGADGFAHGGDAVGIEAGEQDRGFHLGAGNGRGVIDGF